MKKTIVAAMSVGVLALSACGGSGDDATTASTPTATQPGAAAGNTTSPEGATASASDGTGTSPAPSGTATSAASATATSGTATSTGTAPAGGSDAVKTVKLANSPKVVGRWRLSTNVTPIKGSGVYNDGQGQGMNYSVSASMTEQQARERLKSDVTTIPGGVCGNVTETYPTCFLRLDTGGMVTTGGAAKNPKDNLKLLMEFTTELHRVTQ